MDGDNTVFSSYYESSFGREEEDRRMLGLRVVLGVGARVSSKGENQVK
jgi:hypothetical protein